MDFKKGDRVIVRLTKDHLLEGEHVSHPAAFMRLHPDKEWCDVELDEAHAGETRMLSVPVSQLEKS